MNGQKNKIIFILIIFLLLIGTSVVPAKCIVNLVEEKGDVIYLGNVLMIGRISDKKFNGGYVGSYSFIIKCVFTYGNQEPKVQWIEERTGWVCRLDYHGRIGRFFIFAKGDFYLID